MELLASTAAADSRVVLELINSSSMTAAVRYQESLVT
jgi:hypothetical protein